MKAAVGMARTLQVGEARQELVAASVKPQTARAYEAKIALLQRFVAALRHREMADPDDFVRGLEEDDFLRFLLAYPATQGVREALAFMHRRVGMPSFAEEAGVRLCARAAQARKGKGKARGALTREEVDRLVEWSTATGSSFVDWIVVLAGTGLRMSELSALSKSDWKPEEGKDRLGRWYGWIYLRSEKRERAMRPRKEDDKWKLVRDESAALCLEHRSGGEGRFFPKEEGTEQKFREHVTTGMKALGVGDEYRWDGPHVLRHSFVTEVGRLYPEATQEELHQMTKMSQTSRAWYGRKRER